MHTKAVVDVSGSEGGGGGGGQSLGSFSAWGEKDLPGGRVYLVWS